MIYFYAALAVLAAVVTLIFAYAPLETRWYDWRRARRARVQRRRGAHRRLRTREAS